MLHEIVAVFRQVDPQVPMERAATAEAQMDAALQRERALAALAATLGALATAIATIGLYGLLAWSVVRRTREIGIRIALGAQTNQVRWLAVSESVRLLLYGVVLGGPAYLAVFRIFRAQLYQVKPDDPISIGGAILLLSLGAAIATYIPASRFARIDPLRALKYD